MIFARRKHLRQQMSMRQRHHPIRPAQVFNVVSGLQRVVIIADAGFPAEQGGKPVGLMQKICGMF